MQVIDPGETGVHVGVNFYLRVHQGGVYDETWAISGANTAGAVNGQSDNGFTVSFSWEGPQDATVTVPVGAHPGACTLELRGNIEASDPTVDLYNGSFQVNAGQSVGKCPFCPDPPAPSQGGGKMVA